MTKQLKREVNFELKLRYVYSNKEKNLKGMKEMIEVEVDSKETKTQWSWSLKKFRNRYFIINDLFSRYIIENKLPKLNKEIDPFWDP